MPLTLRYEGDERFAFDADQLRARVAEQEEHVPGWNGDDEHPAGSAASLIDDAVHAGVVTCPDGLTLQVISVDEIEESGVVVTVNPTDRVGLGLTCGWTNWNDLRPGEKDKLEDDGARAVYIVERLLAEANGALVRASQ